VEISENEENVVGEIVGSPPPSLRKAYIKIYRGKDVEPLEFLVSSINSNIRVVLRVDDITPVNPFRTPGAIDIAEKTGVPTTPFKGDKAFLMPGVYTLVSADVIDSYKILNNGKIRPLGRSKPPIPGSRVYRADTKIISIITGKPKYPIRIGHLVGARNVPFSFDANILIRHVLIAGNPGTGKSFFRGILMEELYDLGVRQVNFDPLDEYYYTVADIGGVNLVVGKDYKPRLDYLSEGEFRSLIEAHIPTDFQRAIATEGFKRFAEESRRREKFGFGPLDPKELIKYVSMAASAMRASDETKMNVIERLKFFLDSLAIAGTGGVDLANLIEQKRLVNFVFRGLTETQITFAVASILKEILVLKKRGKIGNLLISTDEAHLLVPSGKSNPPSKSIIKRLMRYGRHYGIGILLITQLPASLDREVVSLPSLRIFFAISTDQIKGISYLFADLPQTILRDIPKLERGTAIITGAKDLIRHSVCVKIRSDRRSRHGAPTPSLVDTK